MIPSFYIWVLTFLSTTEVGLSPKSFIVGMSAFIIFILCILFEIRSYRKQQRLIKEMGKDLKVLSESFNKFLEITTGVRN
jgi:hypothetical protein